MGGCAGLMENVKEKDYGQDQWISLPDYMKDPGPANYYHGTLRYSKKKNSWIIR